MGTPRFWFITAAIAIALTAAFAWATSLVTAIFWGVALMTMGSAVFVVLTRNIIHAAFALVMTFGGVAGLYFFLAADFLAAVQLIVYVGGILVLLLFAVMLSSPVEGDGGESGRINLRSGIFVGAMLLAVLGWVISRLGVAAMDNGLSSASFVNSTAKLGVLLLNKYLLPFEVVSLLLLAALIGAVVIARKELR